MLDGRPPGERAVLVHGPSGDARHRDASRRSPAPGTTWRPPWRRRRVATCWSPTRATSRACCSRSIATSRRTSPVVRWRSSDDLVVTTQNVGSEASITVFDHDGAAVTDARTPSVRAGMIAGDSVILVTVDGEIIELDRRRTAPRRHSTPSTVGTVQTGYVSPAGDRLIVVGDGGTRDHRRDRATCSERFPTRVPLDTGINELGAADVELRRVRRPVLPTAGLVIASLDDGIDRRRSRRRRADVVERSTGAPSSPRPARACRSSIRTAWPSTRPTASSRRWRRTARAR